MGKSPSSDAMPVRTSMPAPALLLHAGKKGRIIHAPLFHGLRALCASHAGRRTFTADISSSAAGQKALQGWHNHLPA